MVGTGTTRATADSVGEAGGIPVTHSSERNPDLQKKVTDEEFDVVMRGDISQNDLIERERIEREGLRTSEDLMVLTRLGDAMTDFDYGALLEAVE